VRALVVVCRFLGDTLLATPLARSLHQAGYEVDWLVAPGTEGMIENQPFAHEVHILHPNLGDTARLIRKLFKRYDVACVINGADRPMAVALTAARQTYALVPSRWQDAWKRFLSQRWICNHPEDHMVSYAIELADMAGVTPSRRVGIEWTAEDSQTVGTALGWQGEVPYIHAHPFARWPYKLWPDAHWQALFARIIDHGFNLVVTGGPGEAEKAAALTDTLPKEQVRILAGELSWPQLACLSHGASCYVGLDTANTHLAASTDVPVVALYGPTDPRCWGPWPNGFDGNSPYQPSLSDGIQRVGNIHLMQGSQSCVPCQLEGCERRQDSRSDCLDQLDSKVVWREILDIVEQAA
jgi:heptosyltransferase-3